MNFFSPCFPCFSTESTYNRLANFVPQVAQLQEQLQKERDLRAMLEAVVNMPMEHSPVSSTLDSEVCWHMLEISTLLDC